MCGWVVNSAPRPLYPRERDRVPIVQEAGWAPVLVWTSAENLAPTGIRSPDRPARRKSLYRLSYPDLYAFEGDITYMISQNYVNTNLKDRIRTVVLSIPRETCVRTVNGTVARWLLGVKQDGEQVETVLSIILHISCRFCE
jgi:hypothetical protein